MYNLLSNIKNPDDIKHCSLEQLNELCDEIRRFLISSVSKTGGHLASNLGVVELTVALHFCFDLPKDKIVWDVGHQCYVHKILTNRMSRFSTLRQKDGLSGFPKTSESEYDCFNTGHSSTSISAALGIARGRDLAGDNYHVLAVFGDGALTGGMMYEALNDAGRSKNNLIAILNDNAMSISKNVGAISRYLKDLRSKPGYFKSKQIVEFCLNKIPFFGRHFASFIKKIKWGIKQLILPSTIFDDLGFEYLGPVDGHNIKAMIAVFERAKRIDGPVFVHVHTKKGKGYSLAEDNPQKFHGISKFNINSGTAVSEKHEDDYSEVFGNTLVSLSEKNEKIVAITPAMPIGTGLTGFADKFKNRFFDVGIAEQHAVTFAAGLAVSGFIPVVPIYSSFLQRAYDQILHDVCLQNLHVVLPVDRAGIVGADGETHQGLYDIAFLSHMPNMSILSPSDFNELAQMLDYAVNVHKAPIAIRYPRGNTQADGIKAPFEFGKSITVREGGDLTIITAGRMVKTAQEVSEILLLRGIGTQVISLRTIKPLDEAAIIESAKKTRHMLTLEDGTIIGGIGSMVSSVLENNNIHISFHSLAFPDEPIPHGTIAQLDKQYGLDAESIAKFAMKFLNNGDE
ncbi:MAG: 1-deoxy-D-xylulose-5-phosphate synthase [Clostridia bacterium]|nr:1-deoxy-D-xylulose-5-phosphate synthase [Clostridia bacterium]